MTIVSDYLDIDSTATYELLSPAKQILDNDNTVIKTVKIFLRFIDTTTDSFARITFTNTYDPIIEMPESDVELFNLLKAELSAPSENEDEEQMTPEELMKERDPEGIFQMPLESEKVQQFLAEAREYHREEIQLGAFGRIREAYQEALEGLRQFSAAMSIDRLEITVIYAKKPDLGNDLTLRLSAPSSFPQSD